MFLYNKSLKTCCNSKNSIYVENIFKKKFTTLHNSAKIKCCATLLVYSLPYLQAKEKNFLHLGFKSTAANVENLSEN